MERPYLVEPGTRYFLSETLKQSHEFRLKYENYMVNIGLFIFFLICLGGLLFYKYKGRLTPEEKQKNEKQKQQYILSKIKMFQDNKRRMHQELITGLPQWESEFEAVNLNVLNTRNPFEPL